MTKKQLSMKKLTYLAGQWAANPELPQSTKEIKRFHKEISDSLGGFKGIEGFWWVINFIDYVWKHKND